MVWFLQNIRQLEPTLEEWEQPYLKYYADMKNGSEKDKGQVVDVDEDIEEQQGPKLLSSDEFSVPTTITNVVLAKVVSKLQEIKANQKDLKNQNEELKKQNGELDKKLSIVINLLTGRNTQTSMSTLGDWTDIPSSSQDKDHGQKDGDIDATCNLSDPDLNYIVNLATATTDAQIVLENNEQRVSHKFMTQVKNLLIS